MREIPEEKWINRFLQMADLVSTWSKDPSTSVGCVIARDKRMVSTGFNGFPKGTRDDEKLYADREVKYERVIHAEMNAILFAGQDISDCVLYVTHVPCCRCATVIIQSGIKNIITPPQPSDYLKRWSKQIIDSINLLDEAFVDMWEFNPESIRTLMNYKHFSWDRPV